MQKITIVLIFSFLCSLSSFAQEFESAAGARFGIPLSASYKMYISDSHALEGIAGYRSDFGINYLTAGAAYLIHNPIANDAFKHLYWYYGAGGAIFLGDRSNFIAAQGYLGISLTLDDVPVNFSIDWVPTIPISGGSGFGAGYGAVAVRYILKR